MTRSLRFAAGHFMAVSVVLIGAFVLCDVMRDLQTLIVPDAATRLHAVFLPFGAMVLLTWIYGWLAVPLMLPSTGVGLMILVGVDSITWNMILVSVLKVVAVPLGFDLMRRLGMDARGEGRAANWRVLVGVGLVAALIGNVPRVLAGPCCTGFSPEARINAFVTVTAADVAGVILVLLAAMALFRVLRHA
ncbi:hypothetical protein [Paragemmobacter ruber]|uniref:Uncharacterized protein n=1 Tax=Paragemmobacter ruber TaxID=1985673 RepID=A0ABW9Y5U4_9RHOB|nr:hypothetical protein [Rhodobacter ruber]NBE07788.1 hypothetical protein [Rhodobacter ruber]